MLSYLMDTFVYMKLGIIVLICMSILFGGYLKVKGRRITTVQGAGFLLLAIYFIVIFSLTVSPMYGFENKIDWELANFIPFKVFKDLRENPLNFWGNILMFVPVGFLVPLLSVKFRKARNIILFGAGISLGIEVMQLFLSRGTDIDDLILNTIGTLVGFILVSILLNDLPKIKDKLGIISIKTGKKMKNDNIFIILITMSMLGSVLITGFYQRYGHKSSSYQDASQVSASVGAGKIDGGLGKIGLVSENVCVFNKKSKQEVFSLNKDKKIAPASTTKLVTALTVLDYCDINEKVTVGDEIKHVAKDASKAGIRKGNVLTVKQLLEGMLLPSGNDAAYTLAVHTGKKISKEKKLSEDGYIRLFVKKMNENALKYGAKNSNFISPDGYDADDQYTTAYDMACIADEFLNNSKKQILSEIVKKDQIRECFDGTDVTWLNTNELINPSSDYYYKNAVGLKTGSSSKAGKCLISAANINKDLYIAVVMGDTEESRYEDTLKIFHSLEK